MERTKTNKIECKKRTTSKGEKKIWNAGEDYLDLIGDENKWHNKSIKPKNIPNVSIVL